MYEIRPESIKTFIEDRTVRLPRFQRKQTWDEKKNFALAISLFKGFPLGVVVINKEKAGRTHIKWLLDGRQRRNAFISMLSDPESLYIWGRKFIGFKAADQPYDIQEKFWKKIEEELGKEDEAIDSSSSLNEQEKEEEATTEDIDENNDDKSITETPIEIREQLRDLDLLLEIIILIHNKTKKQSGFTRPFDFEQYTKRLNYIEYHGGEKQLNARKLKTWINEYRFVCSDATWDYKSSETFFNFLKERCAIDDTYNASLKTKINRDWAKILKIFTLLDTIESKLQDTKIGLIELNEANASDAQNTFRIINTAGTPLNAPEIMSAKPSWTAKIDSPSASLIAEVKTLYQSIGTEQDDIVKWDIPATLMNRLEHIDFIFRKLKYDKKDFSKKITLGFQILSAINQKGISKLHIDRLADDSQIQWGPQIDLLVNEINTMGQVLGSASFFQYLKSWKTTIMDITQDAIAINFLIISYLDWKRKGTPVGTSMQTNMFIKNAVINFDKLIYEYITRQWRGPGDVKIAENIRYFDTATDLFIPLSTEKWKQLIEEAITSHAIISAPLNRNEVDSYLKPLLYYSNILQDKQGPAGIDVTIEIDHIIPTTLLGPSTISNKDLKIHNLFNLALLPKKNNLSKTNKLLKDIHERWLKGQITNYTGIPESKFNKYSELTNLNDFKEFRRKILIKAFTELRDRLMEN